MKFRILVAIFISGKYNAPNIGEKVEKTGQKQKKPRLFRGKSGAGSHLVDIQKMEAPLEADFSTSKGAFLVAFW